MNTITVYHENKIADHKMGDSEIRKYAYEHDLQDLIGFSFITKNDDGSFNQDYLDEKLKVFHSTPELFKWQEEMLND